MNILVVGCGKVGSLLAKTLSREGHDVSVVDRDQQQLARLGNDFAGISVIGVPIDQDILRKAGIETCDAVAAVTQDDNVNIMVSQLAREIFKVRNVIARIYDPARENEFQHYGLQTICTTSLTVATINAILSEKTDYASAIIKSHTTHFTTHPAGKDMIGKKLKQLSANEDEAIFAILRKDNSMLLAGSEASENNTVAEGDAVIYVKIVD